MTRKRSRPEQFLQRAVCAHLKVRGVPGLVWFHPPNGGKRSPIEAAIMNGLGVRAGVADLIFLHVGIAYALELKAEGGRQTESQMRFLADWNAAGGFGAVAHGLDAALRILEAWKLLRGTAQ